MTSLWFPGAQRIPGPHAAGLPTAGGNCLLTHHITVSGKTSYAPTRDYLVREGFEPTLLLDPWQGHRGQFLPADRAAYALMHPAGQPETNREGRIHIQVEWLCPDMNTDLSAAPFFAAQWRDLCLWSHTLGVPYTWTFGGPLATSRDPKTWKKAGHRGHRNAPGNDHVDSLPARHAPWPSAPTPTPHPAPAGKDDNVKLIAATGDPSIYVTDFLTKRHLTPAEYEALKPILGAAVALPHDVVNAIPNR